MRRVGRSELERLVRDRHGGHPWLRLCLTGRPGEVEAWDDGGALGWVSGHPWTDRPTQHLLGAPGPALLGWATGPDVITDGAVLTGRRPHGWAFRLLAAPPPVQPGEDRVRWLDDDTGVHGLLDVASLHPAVRPGSALGGRWCGAYEGGELVACAAETVLAPCPHLSSLAVHPRVRGRGLAGAVTAWFARAGFATGADEVMLAVDEGNAVAERVYDRLGFDRWPMLGHHESW